jgi:hypothetical protein
LPLCELQGIKFYNIDAWSDPKLPHGNEDVLVKFGFGYPSICSFCPIQTLYSKLWSISEPSMSNLFGITEIQTRYVFENTSCKSVGVLRVQQSNIISHLTQGVNVKKLFLFVIDDKQA